MTTTSKNKMWTTVLYPFCHVTRTGWVTVQVECGATFFKEYRFPMGTDRKEAQKEARRMAKAEMAAK